MPRDAAAVGEEEEVMLMASLDELSAASASFGSAARRDGLVLEDVPASVEEAIAAAAARNREGMQLLRQGGLQEALELLNQARGQAQALLDAAEEPAQEGASQQALAAARADTLSNLGVYHRRQGDRELAIRCLQQGLRLHRAAGARRRVLVAAHLNLAACHLEVQAAGAALQHATAAVELGGQVVAEPELGVDVPIGDDEAGAVDRPQADAPQADDYAMLAVAYHKVAEAYEGLREWGKATFAYMQAYEVVRHSLGPKHHLTRTFERSSRCPGRTCAPSPPCPAPAPPRSARGAPGGGRLPQIQRPRSRGSAGAPPAQAYELTKDLFPPWPPQTATREERRWYALASRRPSSRQGSAAAPPPAAGGLEPTLESLTSLRARAARA